MGRTTGPLVLHSPPGPCRFRGKKGSELIVHAFHASISGIDGQVDLVSVAGDKIGCGHLLRLDDKGRRRLKSPVFFQKRHLLCIDFRAFVQAPGHPGVFAKITPDDNNDLQIEFWARDEKLRKYKFVSKSDALLSGRPPPARTQKYPLFRVRF
jgi:hypothetical protein